MRRATILTQRTVPPVPSLRAHAGTVLALAVLGAARIAHQLIAQAARPAVVAPAPSILADTVGATVQAAHSC